MSLPRILIVAFVTLGLVLPSVALAKGPKPKKPKKIMLQCEVLGPHKVRLTNQGTVSIKKMANVVVLRGATGPVIMKWKQQPSKVISPRDAIIMHLEGKGNDLDGKGTDLVGKPGMCKAFVKLPTL